MATNNKMQWFIDKYNRGTLDYIIRNTGYDFGTVCMPTGTGKSGVVYEDIVHVINNNQKGHKVVINISCPILKLNQQFINDMFSVFNEIYKGSDTNFNFYINSSDNGKNYNDSISVMDINVDKFSKFDNFINDPDTDIAIVASCHKSMFKFINKISKIKGIEVISYIDEAHLIDVKSSSKKSDISKEDDAIVKVDINKLCRYSSRVYALSATPDVDVTRVINGWNSFGSKSTKYIYQLSPIEAINSNTILPPLVNYIKTESRICVDMLKKIMKTSEKKAPEINHKILVTLTSAQELVELRNELEKLNYKVFSTCSTYGYGSNKNIEDDPEYNDVTEFIKDIETWDGNCFVLHIRQLIQGIDVKGLTDCVIWSASNGNQSNYRHTIQTIGRTLRPLNGERGLSTDKRKKKVGMVYFITPEEKDEIQKNISQFICRYYGLDNVLFESSSYKQNGIDADDRFENFNFYKTSSGWANEDIVKFLFKVEDYIKNKVIPTKKLLTSIGAKFNIDSEINSILTKFDAFGMECDSADLLDNKPLVDAIKELYNKYND